MLFYFIKLDKNNNFIIIFLDEIFWKQPAMYSPQCGNSKDLLKKLLITFIAIFIISSISGVLWIIMQKVFCTL